MLLDECTFGGEGGLDYIVEGFDQLPRNLMKNLTKEIQFRSKVSSVKSTKNGTRVQVVVNCSGADCPEGDPHL